MNINRAKELKIKEYNMLVKEDDDKYYSKVEEVKERLKMDEYDISSKKLAKKIIEKIDEQVFISQIEKED